MFCEFPVTIFEFFGSDVLYRNQESRDKQRVYLTSTELISGILESGVMEELFKIQGIVRSIAQNLSIADYLSFSCVSKFVNQTLKPLDQDYFKERLQQVHITYNPNYTADLLYDYHATNVFNSIKVTADPKKTVVLIYRLLKPFLERIRKEDVIDLDEFNFQELFGFGNSDINDQAKILQSLKKFALIDNNDAVLHNETTERVRNLTRKFTKVKFEEMQESFDQENYYNVHRLVGCLNILDQEDLVVEFFQQENKFPMDFFPPTILNIDNSLQEEALDDVIKDLVEFFNSKSKITDECFGDQLPVMLLYTEHIIEKNLIKEYFTKECEKNIEVIPTVYIKLLNDFVGKLNDSKNAGDNYKKMMVTFINLYFEPLVFKFIDEEIVNFEDDSIKEIQQFEAELTEQEKIEQDNIYQSVLTEYSTEDVKSNKFELLSSFTKIFNKSNKDTNEIKFKVNFEIVNKNLKNLKNFINFELCYKIIEIARAKIELFSIFNKSEYSIVDQQKINSQIEELFIRLVKIVLKYHIKPGFIKAIDFLNRYDPNEFKSLESLDSMSTVEPLKKFTELINIGDLIQQMIEIFYENELVMKKILNKDEFLNNANQTKKQFETSLDNFVANGLNIGIDKLMAEIEFLYNTLQLPNDFNPKTTNENETVTFTGPTKCAEKVVVLLSNHMNLLNGSTEKGIIDIFQQEIGERFFQVIVKNIKKRIISTTGSIILISDLNLYYNFVINTLRQKNITPLFIGLKEIGQLYLISTDDSKELGKLIGDLSKFNGIFKQEEIYEFVQKRADWFKIKKDVEKAMYGLGITDCVIM